MTPGSGSMIRPLSAQCIRLKPCNARLPGNSSHIREVRRDFRNNQPAGLGWPHRVGRRQHHGDAVCRAWTPYRRWGSTATRSSRNSGLRRSRSQPCVLPVRINDASSRWFDADLQWLQATPPVGVMLAKAEDGAPRVDGRMVDKPVLFKAQALLSRA